MQFEYENMAGLFAQIGPGIDVTECHGVLCGLLSTKREEARLLWFKHVLSQAGLDDSDANDIEMRMSQAGALLEPIYIETHRQLNSIECDFQPVLPGDSSEIADRTRSLAHWAQGFLVGISFGGVEDLKELPKDSMEIMMDMTKIAKAGNYSVEGTEEDEIAFSEVYEYLRAAVLLVYQEMNPSGSEQSADKNQLH